MGSIPIKFYALLAPPPHQRLTRFINVILWDLLKWVFRSVVGSHKYSDFLWEFLPWQGAYHRRPHQAPRCWLSSTLWLSCRRYNPTACTCWLQLDWTLLQRDQQKIHLFFKKRKKKEMLELLRTLDSNGHRSLKIFVKGIGAQSWERWENCGLKASLGYKMA